MKAIEILFPVFFMMLLGWLSRKKRWITTAQNEGAKSLVFNILFPLLVFHVLMEAELSANFLYEIIFLDVAWVIIYLIGKRIAGPVSGRYARLAPFLLMTCEGGSVALPLYIALVGAEHAVNIITFDVAGILINFGLVPALITKQTSREVAFLPLAKRIVTAPFIVAVILGIVANVLNVQHWLVLGHLNTIFSNTMSMATTPIASVILFTLGYGFHLHLSTETTFSTEPCENHTVRCHRWGLFPVLPWAYGGESVPCWCTTLLCLPYRFPRSATDRSTL